MPLLDQNETVSEVFSIAVIELLPNSRQRTLMVNSKPLGRVDMIDRQILSLSCARSLASPVYSSIKWKAFSLSDAVPDGPQRQFSQNIEKPAGSSEYEATSENTSSETESKVARFIEPAKPLRNLTLILHILNSERSNESRSFPLPASH